ncbi:MAG: tetratricopeptide repeat protein [Candidatus Paceibacterota bacterium]
MEEEKNYFKQNHLSLIVLGLFLLFIAFISYTYLSTPKVNYDPIPQVSLDPAIQAYDNNDFDTATAKINEVLAAQKDNIQALLLLASIYTTQGSIQFKEQEYSAKAMELANKVLKLDPQNAEAHRILGYAYEMIKNYPKAIEEYTKSLAISDNPVTYYHRGHAYDLSGDFEKAKADYDLALAGDNTDPIALLNMGRVYWRSSNYKTAESLFNKALENTNNIRVKAEIYYDLSSIAKYGYSDEKASLDYANKAVATDPTYAEGYVGQARVYINQGDNDKASEALNNAITSNPNLSLAYEWAGMAYFNNKDFTEALRFFDKAKELAASDNTIMDNERASTASRIDFFSAASYSAQNKKDEAVLSLKGAMKSADVVTLTMISNAISQGKNGLLANLVGYAPYEAIIRSSNKATSPVSIKSPTLFDKVLASVEKLITMRKAEAATTDAVTVTCSPDAPIFRTTTFPVNVKWTVAVSPDPQVKNPQYKWIFDGIRSYDSDVSVHKAYSNYGTYTATVTFNNVTSSACKVSIVNLTGGTQSSGFVVRLAGHTSCCTGIDNNFTYALQQYTNGNININTLLTECNSWLGGGVTCSIVTYLNGSMGIGCANIDAAIYIPPLTVACFPDRNSIVKGSDVTWSAQASGGLAYNGHTYAYSWSSPDSDFVALANNLKNQIINIAYGTVANKRYNSSTISKTTSLLPIVYNEVGNKTMLVTVSSINQALNDPTKSYRQYQAVGGQTVSIRCPSVNVADACLGPNVICEGQCVDPDSPFCVPCEDGQQHLSDGSCPVNIPTCDHSNFCKNGDVYKKNDKCVEVKVQDCLYGCENGKCLPATISACSHNQFCQDGNLYQKNELCEDTLWTECEYGCRNNACIQNCTRGGVTVADGESRIFYTSRTVGANQTCSGVKLTCVSGTFYNGSIVDVSHKYPTCVKININEF